MTRSVKIESILYYLDSLLGIPEFPDYDGAQNGLQVAGPDEVHRVAVAVDASEATVTDAVGRGAQLLIVHHGLYWDGLRPLTGRSFRRVAPLIRGGTALYAAHLPLDAHLEVGNCALLSRAVGIEPIGRFMKLKGAEIGVRGVLRTTRDELVGKVAQAVGGPVRLIPGGPERVREIGIVTGGGGSAVAEAAGAGLDTLITGEGSHHTFLDAVEYGVNLLFAGHYATETFGVKALGARLEAEFGVEWSFLDHPTGM